MVDEADSKSVASDGVWVRVPPPAPEKGHPKGCPFSGGQPSAGKDSLRSIWQEGKPIPSCTTPLKSIPGSNLDYPGAPRQNKAKRSCVTASGTTSTACLVLPYQTRPADAGLASDRGCGLTLDWSGAFFSVRARDDWVLPARRAAAATAHKGAKPNQKAPSPRREVQRFR